MTVGRRSVEVSVAADGSVTADDSSLTGGGSTSAVLNDAIQSLPTSGGRLSLDAGHYATSDPIVVDRPLALSGAGPGNTTDVENMTLLVAEEDLDGPVIEITGANSDGGYMHGTHVADLGVVGTGDPETGDDCLRFDRTEDVRLTKVSLERLIVDSAGRHGVAFETVDHHINVTNVWSGHHHGDAFALDDGERYWLTNCYGYDSEVGIDVGAAVTDCSLVVPHCRRNDEAGVAIAGGPAQIHGGRFIQNDGAGIAVDGADHVTVAHPECFNNAGPGITVGTDEERTSRTRVYGPRVGNVGGGNEVPVSTGNLPSRLRELGVRGAVSKLRNYGVSNVVSGYLPGGTIDKSQAAGIVVGDHAVDTVLSEPVYTDLSGTDLTDRGTRTVVDGLGTNQGPPDEGGQWAGHGSQGLWVVDAASDAIYLRGADGWYGPFGSSA
jgi:hypothetical protein